MITYEDLAKLCGITDRDEMTKACAIIPDEDLRSALVLTLCAWNTGININNEIFQKKEKEIAQLNKKIEKLEKQIQALKNEK